MKRVKVILTAICLLSVVGGALAFKAAKRSTVCYYERSGSAGDCTQRVANSNIGSVITTGSLYNTAFAKGTDPCPAADEQTCDTRHSKVSE